MTQLINESRLRSAVGAGPLADDAAEGPLLVEVAWETCQQVGGIYTVVRSKAEAMVARWRRAYCLLGPYNPETSPAEFEAAEPSGPFGQAAATLQELGYEAHFGAWLTPGRPQTVLLNPACVRDRLAEIKYLFWKDHDTAMTDQDPLVDQVATFSFLVEEFFRVLSEQQAGKHAVIGHFHEWMGGAAIPALRHHAVPVAIVFTTHATLLGRYLAMHDPWFYDHLPFADWLKEARHFNIEPQVRLERAAAHGAHVFTTLSDITAFECERLVGRKPDVLLPNGLNLDRFTVLHEFQNLHRSCKARIHQFTMAHFFPSYHFDLDKTIYFFTSGRHEYRNKGFDLTIEALSRLNGRIRDAGLDCTVVFFLISKQPYRSISPEALHSRAVMEEIRHTCQHITDQIGEGLFYSAATGEMPDLSDLVEDAYRLRLRRMIQAWQTTHLPAIATHDLEDNVHDEVLKKLRECQLINWAEDPVKVIYHPDFINAANPLFGIDYDQFVRGCHMGIFPSAYEPWGYTPLECIARGVPAVTSDLSGFGTYVLKTMPDHRNDGLLVVNRRYKSHDHAVLELTDWMFDFACLDRRGRIALRNRVESASRGFDWDNLGKFYFEAEDLALARSGLQPE